MPVDVGRDHAGRASTQQELGRFFVDLAHAAPDVAARVVSVSPDVGTSTNLGGWINRVGVWSIGDRVDWFADDTDTLVRWRESEHGQHIELGIAEGNLVGLLGELGATWSRDGQPLLPIGTIYDPFVNRALEQWSFGMYAGGQSILIGTPAGVTLAPEGGAHQSIITPSVGLEQPRCTAWEPAFGQDLEWMLLHALARLGRPDGASAYLRLSTRPLDQSLAAMPADPAAREAPPARGAGRRLPAAAAATRSGRRAVTLVGMGVVMPEVLAAADELAGAGIEAASRLPDLGRPRLPGAAGASRARAAPGPTTRSSTRCSRADRATPIVTVLDGHPHTLCFLGAVNGAPISCLGVQDFGQSGDVQDLYRYFGIDAETIVGAALDLI